MVIPPTYSITQSLCLLSINQFFECFGIQVSSATAPERNNELLRIGGWFHKERGCLLPSTRRKFVKRSQEEDRAELGQAVRRRVCFEQVLPLRTQRPLPGVF